MGPIIGDGWVEEEGSAMCYPPSKEDPRVRARRREMDQSSFYLLVSSPICETLNRETHYCEKKVSRGEDKKPRTVRLRNKDGRWDAGISLVGPFCPPNAYISVRPSLPVHHENPTRPKAEKP